MIFFIYMFLLLFKRLYREIYFIFKIALISLCLFVYEIKFVINKSIFASILMKCKRFLWSITWSPCSKSIKMLFVYDVSHDCCGWYWGDFIKTDMNWKKKMKTNLNRRILLDKQHLKCYNLFCTKQAVKNWKFILWKINLYYSMKNNSKNLMSKFSSEVNTEELNPTSNVNSSHPTTLPYPMRVFFIVGNEFCERFNYFGMKGENLIF